MAGLKAADTCRVYIILTLYFCRNLLTITTIYYVLFMVFFFVVGIVLGVMRYWPPPNLTAIQYFNAYAYAGEFVLAILTMIFMIIAWQRHGSNEKSPTLLGIWERIREDH